MARKGIKFTEEHKRKLREAKMGMKNNRYGKCHTKKAKQKISNALMGHAISDRTKNKISKSLEGHAAWNGGLTAKDDERILSGNNHYNWQGGKSFEPYSTEFNGKLKEQIRKRDNYTCQLCCVKQKELNKKLDVHHKDYNKKNSRESNLVSLCKPCHLQTNHNKLWWLEYFLEI